VLAKQGGMAKSKYPEPAVPLRTWFWSCQLFVALKPKAYYECKPARWSTFQIGSQFVQNHYASIVNGKQDPNSTPIMKSQDGPVSPPPSYVNVYKLQYRELKTDRAERRQRSRSGSSGPDRTALALPLLRVLPRRFVPTYADVPQCRLQQVRLRAPTFPIANQNPCILQVNSRSRLQQQLLSETGSSIHTRCTHIRTKCRCRLRRRRISSICMASSSNNRFRRRTRTAI